MSRPTAPVPLRTPAWSASRRSAARATLRLAAGTLAWILVAALPAAGDPVRDTLPFRIAFGRPPIVAGAGTTAYFWIQGGRLRLRISPDEQRHRVEGELRTSGEGRFEDVTPLSENLRVRQPRPDKLLFDLQTATNEEGLDVTLAGDFSQVTIDLLVDGERRPAILRIGEKGRSPDGLPARLDLHNAASSWIERFGF